MQGSVWGSLCYAVLMDMLGKLVYSQPDLLYLYKGIVEVPTLQMVDDIIAVQKCSPQSLHLNTVVNSFMDLEKLTLSKNKCHKLHTGKPNRNCKQLKVHDNVMHEASTETYLGDKIDISGKNNVNIAARVGKGFGRVKTILAMLKEAPLGWTKVKAGLKLRKAMLINGVMFNSESWHGVTKEDVRNLERVDEALLSGLVTGHAALPLPALYLELGVEPLRYIWACRRIMYLHTLLNRSNKEITKKVLNAQIVQPSKGDFCELVNRDIQMIKLEKTYDEIAQMKKTSLKILVKSKIQVAAFNYLMMEKQPKTKMDKIKYSKLQISPYLMTPLFKHKEAVQLFALRTRTVRGIQSDFGEMYVDKHCPLQCGDIDTVENILKCNKLQNHIKCSQKDIKYDDIFSSDISKQKAATLLYMDLMEQREQLMEARQLG